MGFKYIRATCNARNNDKSGKKRQVQHHKSKQEENRRDELRTVSMNPR